MMIKLQLPEEAEILRAENGDIIFRIPRFYGMHETAVNVFSVDGKTLQEFEDNNLIEYIKVLVDNNGKLIIER